MELTVRTFKAFCKRFEGKILTTLYQKKQFRVAVLPESIEFTPLSSNKRRLIGDDGLVKIIERYKNTRSLKTTDYRDLTFKASYLLTLLLMADKQKEK